MSHYIKGMLFAIMLIALWSVAVDKTMTNPLSQLNNNLQSIIVK